MSLFAKDLFVHLKLVKPATISTKFEAGLQFSTLLK